MRRLIAGAGAFAAAIAIAVPGALAATPEEIYRDYADNGRLDGDYSVRDLQRALKDAVVQGYGGPKGQVFEPKVKKKIREQVKPPLAVAPVKKKGGALPFTGLDLALITIGGASLLAFGAGLRRFARRSS